MNSAVGTGMTLEAAVMDALKSLGAQPDQVTLKKLEEGGPAGLMGGAARPFRVRATWRPEFAPPPPPPPAPEAGAQGVFRGRHVRPRRRSASAAIGRIAVDARSVAAAAHGPSAGNVASEAIAPRARIVRSVRVVRTRRSIRASASTSMTRSSRKVRAEAEWLLGRLGLDAKVAVAHEADEVTVSITSEVDDALLTGRRGDTRLSIQHVLSRLVNPRRGPGAHLLVDVNGYWAERKESLLSRAKALAAEALASGDEATTEPLSAEERRVVHRALTADGSVTTESFGDGALKRIAIRPALKG